MRFIPTWVHGIMDYLMSLVLLTSPWLFGFHYKSDKATTVPLLLGAGTIVYSLFTNYELGLIKLIPMALHLITDALSGIFLAASPWLFKFSLKVFIPHIVMGAIEVGAALFSKV